MPVYVSMYLLENYLRKDHSHHQMYDFPQNYQKIHFVQHFGLHINIVLLRSKSQTKNTKTSYSISSVKINYFTISTADG